MLSNALIFLLGLLMGSVGYASWNLRGVSSKGDDDIQMRKSSRVPAVHQKPSVVITEALSLNFEDSEVENVVRIGKEINDASSQIERTRLFCEHYSALLQDRDFLGLSLLVREMTTDDFQSSAEKLFKEKHDISFLINSYGSMLSASNSEGFSSEKLVLELQGSLSLSDWLTKYFISNLDKNISATQFTVNDFDLDVRGAKLNSENCLPYVRRNPQKVFDWCLNGSEKQQKNRDEVFEHLLRFQPSFLAQELTRLPKEQRDSVEGSLVEQLVESDPSLLFEEYTQKKTVVITGEVVTEMFYNWAEFDLSAASESIARLSSLKDKDYAISGMVEKISEIDPEAASEWAESISDIDLRESTLLNLR